MALWGPQVSTGGGTSLLLPSACLPPPFPPPPAAPHSHSLNCLPRPTYHRLGHVVLGQLQHDFLSPTASTSAATGLLPATMRLSSVVAAFSLALGMAATLASTRSYRRRRRGEGGDAGPAGATTACLAEPRLLTPFGPPPPLPTWGVAATAGSLMGPCLGRGSRRW